ncbi:MAG TPA: TIGR03084 family metal-binding protein [Mycobacteriales bacterium]|jgi:uncharacterized protein (TIGR03084 family)|nr:TIGR03084 family metal-binding protein [Mycobacteriales bacterium]
MRVAELVDDFVAEREEITGMLDGLDERTLRLPTPAPGWSVHDQVTHLAWFDGAANLAITDPDRFRRERDEVMTDVDGFVERVARDHRTMSSAEAIRWLRDEGSALTAATAAADPATRVPWYGPDMTVASSITARIMETWAHGQDIADTFGIQRQPSDRLRHVAFIGWRALPNSFRANGLPVPEQAVRVEVDSLVFGSQEATNVVRGTALDFCLLVTQRRHLDDTALKAEGPIATQWLTIAQAFAGPPGAGRVAGQFA